MYLRSFGRTKKDKELIKESVGMENIQIKIIGPSRLDECFYFYLNKKDINNIRDNYLPKNTKPTLENVTQFLHQLPDDDNYSQDAAEQEFGTPYKTVSAFENIHTGDVDIEIGSSGSTYKNKVNLKKIERVYEEIEFPDEAILLGKYYETISANPVDLGSWKGTYYFLEVDKIDFPLEDIQKHLIMKKVYLFDSVFHERPALKLNSGKILNFETDSCYEESSSWSTNHTESPDFFIHHKFKSELEKFENASENTKILCQYNSNENIFYNDDGEPTPCLNFYDEILNNDKKLMYDAVKKCGPSIRFVSKSLQKDFELAKLAISKADYSIYSFPYLDKTMKNDKSICLEAMRNHGSNLFYLDSKYKKDKEIVLEAVKQHGGALQFADDSLKKDREIVLEAVKQHGGALEFADDNLKKDKEIVLEALKEGSGAIYHTVENERRRTADSIMDIGSNKGTALEFADDSFKKDKEIVSFAVKQGGGALQFADDSLKKDREIVIEALKEGGYALQYADDSLKKDKKIVLEVVKQDGYALQYADDSLKKDKEIVLEAIKQDGFAVQYVDDSFKKDKEIVLEAIKQDGDTLKYADNSLKNDPNILAIVNKDK